MLGCRSDQVSNRALSQKPAAVVNKIPQKLNQYESAIFTNEPSRSPSNFTKFESKIHCSRQVLQYN
jgi:hypothetical protein